MSVVTADDFIVETTPGIAVSLDQRRAEFRRRRRVLGIREWASLAATGAIGLWVAAVIMISVAPR